MKLTTQTSIQIRKEIQIVYEGIVDPQKINKYFLEFSSARLETGKDCVWKFPEFDQTFPITKVETQPYDFVKFVWDPQTTVSITLEKRDDHNTLVKVREGSKEWNEKNVKWVLENTAGWANFLACLKAYLEYDVQLRKGAFDFLKTS